MISLNAFLRISFVFSLLSFHALSYIPTPLLKTSTKKTPVFMKLDSTKRSNDSSQMQHASSRRDFFSDVVAFSGVASALITSPKPGFGISPFLPDGEVEPSQLPTGDKVDINGAFVGDYKQFRGMFPHAAGKIASNGPYTKVSDIYKIKGITQNDIKVFKKYEKELTALPPGRMFNERINNRVST